MAAIAPTLFDAPAEPVFSAGVAWLNATLFGTAAMGLCIVAVSFVGLLLMSGRLAIREALRTLIGCFVLLGAPGIALSLNSLTTGSGEQVAPQMMMPVEASKATPLPPANYDPYAGASLRPE